MNPEKPQAEISQDPSELVITRTISAPKAHVFSAWIEPKLLSQWFGPKNFTVPVCTMDARQGGAYRIVMRSPEGIDYPLKGVCQQISSPELLVLTQDLSEHPTEWFAQLNSFYEGDGTPAKSDVLTVTFEEKAGKTLLTLRTRFDSIATRDAMAKMGMNEGWTQTLDRLEDLLTQQA